MPGAEEAFILVAGKHQERRRSGREERRPQLNRTTTEALVFTGVPLALGALKCQLRLAAARALEPADGSPMSTRPSTTFPSVSMLTRSFTSPLGAACSAAAASPQFVPALSSRFASRKLCPISWPALSGLDHFWRATWPTVQLALR